jgi:hypothetical protein
MRVVMTELADAAMVVYLRDGPALWALVLVDGSARLVPLGRWADAEEALLRLRADLDAQAGRAMAGRLAAAVATQRDAAGALEDFAAVEVNPWGVRVGPTGVLLGRPPTPASGNAEPGGMADERDQLAKGLALAEYQSLRAEIIKSIGIQFQLAALAIVAFGSLLSLAFTVKNSYI